MAAIDGQVQTFDRVVEVLQRIHILGDGGHTDLHPDVAGADGVAGEELAVVHQIDYRAGGMAGYVNDLDGVAGIGDGVAVLNGDHLAGVVAQLLDHAGAVIGADVDRFHIGLAHKIAQFGDVVAVVMGENQGNLGALRILDGVGHEVIIEVAAAHAGIDDQDLVAVLEDPDGINVPVQHPLHAVAHVCHGVGQGRAGGAVVGALLVLLKEPVVDLLILVDLLPGVVGIGSHGAGQILVVFHGIVAVILEGLDRLGGAFRQSGGVISRDNRPDRQILQRLKGGPVVFIVALIGHPSADGNGSGEEGGIVQNHLPGAHAAHGHTLDVDPVGVHVGMVGDKGVQQGLDRIGVPAAGHVVGALRRHHIDGVAGQMVGLYPDGSALVGDELGDVIVAALPRAVEEEDQGIGAVFAEAVFRGIKVAVIHIIAAGGVIVIARLEAVHDGVPHRLDGPGLVTQGHGVAQRVADGAGGVGVVTGAGIGVVHI